MTDAEKAFFDLEIGHLVELVMAADYLEISGLYHSVRQSIAARIKGKPTGEACLILRQDCNLGQARIKSIFAENPWLTAVFTGQRIQVSIEL